MFRAIVERHLAVTLEGRWSLPVNLIDPDGVRTDGLRGQVLYDIRRMNPETGEGVTVNVPVVTLRRSSLTRLPLPGETWLVEIPESVTDPTTVQFLLSSDRPPEGGKSIGFIRLYLQQVEQS